MLRLALTLILAACSGPGTPPPRHATRTITARTRVPAAIQTLLPVHGIYAAGSGRTSPAWRVVVDVDRNTIYAGTSKKPNAPSSGPMQSESRKDLSDRNKVFLMQLAEDAWREAPSGELQNPTADTGEIFVVLDGEDAFYLQSAGPIGQPLAVKAIIELRAAGGL